MLPHYQFSVISRTLVVGVVLPLCIDTVGIFYNPQLTELDNFCLEEFFYKEILRVYLFIGDNIRGTFNKFPDFFVQAFKNCRRLLKIHDVIAVHIMR